MRKILLGLLLIAAAAFPARAQDKLLLITPTWTVTAGTAAPNGSACNQPQVGNLYVRSEDTGNGPVGVFRCTQIAPTIFLWQPIDHLVVTTLPATCAVGDIVFKSNASAGSNLYGCTTPDHWTAQAGGGGGSSAFDAITTGTNTTATMTVGTGASLARTGTGVIDANQVNGTALSGLATGLLKNTTTTGVPSIAASGTDYAPATSGSSILKGNGSGGFSSAVASNVIALFSGCSGSQYLGADGACHNSGGGGGSPAGSTNDIQVNVSGSFGALTNFSNTGAVFNAVGSAVTVEAVPNPTFVSGGTGWTVSGDFVLATGSATLNAGLGNGSGILYIYPSASTYMTSGQQYSITLTVASTSGSPSCAVSTSGTYNKAYPFGTLTTGANTITAYYNYSFPYINVYCTETTGTTVISQVSVPISVNPRMFAPGLLTGGSVALAATGQTLSENNNDSNYHVSFKDNLDAGLNGLNFGFPTITHHAIYTALQDGFNDNNNSDSFSKITVIGLSNLVDSIGAGQRIIMSNAGNCYGMGDCFAKAESLYMWGGMNAEGDEGLGHKRDELSQGKYLAHANLLTIPTQSTCAGTITVAVTQSHSQEPQLVPFTRTAGTCAAGEYIDIDDGPIYADTRHEVPVISIGYNGSTIGVIFEANHAINAPVLPATILDVDNPSYFGQLRYLVNYSGPRHSGTIASQSGLQFILNDSPGPTIVGGNSTLPGIFVPRQDDYMGYPFGQGYVCHGTITAAITASGSPQAKSFTKTSAASTCLTGALVTINPSKIDQEVVTLTADAESGTFTAIFTKNHLINAVATDGADWDHTLHSQYGIQYLTSGNVVAIAHRGAGGVSQSYSGFAGAGGDYTILPGARVFHVLGSRVVLEHNTFAWTVGDLVDEAISTDGNMADTNFYSWWMPGATLFDAQNVLNTGVRTIQAAMTISSRMPVGSNSDSPWAWTAGISIGGAKTGLALSNPLTAAINIGNDDYTLYNGNITWGSDARMGINGNVLDPGQFSIGSGIGSALDFGRTSSAGSNGLTQLRWRGMVTVLGPGASGGQLQIGQDDGSGGFDLIRLVKDSQGLTFRGVETTAATDVALLTLSVNAGGVIAPALGTATAGVNYGSHPYLMEVKQWNGTGSATSQVGAVQIDFVSGSTGANARMNFNLPANCSGHFYYGFSSTPLQVQQDGKLTFGLPAVTSDCYATAYSVTLDPTGLGATPRTITVPDLSGTWALTGASQTVSFGATTVSSLTSTGSVKLQVTVVGSLGTCNGGAEGSLKAVTDATAPVFNTTLTGGGSVHSGARCDGTNWVAF